MNISGTHVEFGLCEYSNEFSDSHVEKWLLDLCWVSNIIHFLLTLQRNMVPWAQWKTMSTVLISKENDSLTAILIGKYKKKKKRALSAKAKVSQATLIIHRVPKKNGTPLFQQILVSRRAVRRGLCLWLHGPGESWWQTTLQGLAYRECPITHKSCGWSLPCYG